MRRLPVAMLFIHVIFIPVGYTQDLDSLSHSIDSSSKAIEQTTKDLDRWTDSTQQITLRHQTTQNSRNLDQFLADMKEQERKEKRQTYIRIGFGAAFLVVLIIGLARRRKIRNGEV
ncbi:MAG: hypothetical protein JWR72_2082 [Flavisolibacter sp.]|jgi:uncharacterized protein YoxC|nr:hypothetical protein [Flavisolibacter sp.]